MRKLFENCRECVVRLSHHCKYLFGSSARLRNGSWNRRSPAKNRTTVTGCFLWSPSQVERVMHATCTAPALPSRVAAPSSRYFQVQGRRPQVQEELVLKEVAAQKERPWRMCYYFSCFVLHCSYLRLAVNFIILAV